MKEELNSNVRGIALQLLVGFNDECCKGGGVETSLDIVWVIKATGWASGTGHTNTSRVSISSLQSATLAPSASLIDLAIVGQPFDMDFSTCRRVSYDARWKCQRGRAVELH